MIKILFFAQLAELANTDALHIDYAEGFTPNTLIEELDKRYSVELVDALKDEATIVAINQQVAERDQLLVAGDELAFLPPFSGG